MVNNAPFTSCAVHYTSSFSYHQYHSSFSFTISASTTVLPIPPLPTSLILCLHPPSLVVFNCKQKVLNFDVSHHVCGTSKSQTYAILNPQTCTLKFHINLAFHYRFLMRTFIIFPISRIRTQLIESEITTNNEHI